MKINVSTVLAPRAATCIGTCSWASTAPSRDRSSTARCVDMDSLVSLSRVAASPAVPDQDRNGQRQYIKTTNHSVSAEGEPTCDPVKPRNASDRDSDPEDGWHAGL